MCNVSRCIRIWSRCGPRCRSRCTRLRETSPVKLAVKYTRNVRMLDWYVRAVPHKMQYTNNAYVCVHIQRCVSFANQMVPICELETRKLLMGRAVKLHNIYRSTHNFVHLGEFQSKHGRNCFALLLSPRRISMWTIGADKISQTKYRNRYMNTLWSWQ